MYLTFLYPNFFADFCARLCKREAVGAAGSRAEPIDSSSRLDIVSPTGALQPDDFPFFVQE